MKKLISIIISCAIICCLFSGCAPKNDNMVVIYTCATDIRIAHMNEALHNKFPDINIIVEYQPTSKVTAKLLAEGLSTECDIIHDLYYLNMDALNSEDLLADLSEYDRSIYIDGIATNKNYLPEIRVGASAIINTDVLKSKGLNKPTSYQDLLKPEYKGLISMPDPKSSSTGYVFVKGLVNAWGEDKAFDYFEKLSENVLQFTSAGNGPVNALVQQEVAIGLTLIYPAVTQINEGAPLEVVIFEEGANSSMYGQSIIKGKETDQNVKLVFDYLINEYTEINCQTFGSEQIYKNKVFHLENYPTITKYADMSNDSLEEKDRLLEKWGTWEQ